jgi:hypothetical protein
MKVTYAAALILTLALTGCAANYTFNGQRYNSRSDFLAAVESNYTTAVNSVVPLSQPNSSKKLMFAFPSKDVISKTSVKYFQEQNGRSPSGVQDEMLNTLNEANYKGNIVYFDAIKRRNIYQSVRLVELDSVSASIAASADEDVLYYVEPTRGSGTYYYVSAKGGKQVFAYDRAQPDLPGKLKAFVDAVQLQAIRN